MEEYRSRTLHRAVITLKRRCVGAFVIAALKIILCYVAPLPSLGRKIFGTTCQFVINNSFEAANYNASFLLVVFHTKVIFDCVAGASTLFHLC